MDLISKYSAGVDKEEICSPEKTPSKAEIQISEMWLLQKPWHASVVAMKFAEATAEPRKPRILKRGWELQEPTALHALSSPPTENLGEQGPLDPPLSLPAPSAPPIGRAWHSAR